jgi:hypothetical protein
MKKNGSAVGCSPRATCIESWSDGHEFDIKGREKEEDGKSE